MKKAISAYIPCPQISLENWFEILLNQERNHIVVSIREEILSKAFEKCEEIDETEKCAQFVVDCAREAWKKLFYVEFFNKDATCSDPQEDPNWMSGKIPDPCPPDPWASNRVKMQKDKNIFYFGDNPPEASHMSLKDEITLVPSNTFEGAYEGLPAASKSSKHGSLYQTSIMGSRIIENECREEENDGEFGDLGENFDFESYSDSLEDDKSVSAFTFTKHCGKSYLPFIEKEVRASRKCGLQRKTSVNFEDKPVLAKGRNTVKELNPFHSVSTFNFSKSSFGKNKQFQEFQNLRGSIKKQSLLLPPVEKKFHG